MPTAFEPKEMQLFWLKKDASKPKASRPAFQCSAPSRRLMRKYNALFDACQDLYAQAKSVPDEDRAQKRAIDDQIFEKFTQMILLGVTGPVNMPQLEGVSAEFNADWIEDALASDEIEELAFGWPSAFEMNENERKNLLSPLQSDAAKSAADASAASAPISPATESSPGAATSPAPSAAAPSLPTEPAAPPAEEKAC